MKAMFPSKKAIQKVIVADMENFLTVDELSEKLKVSKVWLYKLVREKRIPFYHIEKCIRFSPSDIQNWLEERRNKEWRRDK